MHSFGSMPCSSGLVMDIAGTTLIRRWIPDIPDCTITAAGVMYNQKLQFLLISCNERSEDSVLKLTAFVLQFLYNCFQGKHYNFLP